MIRAGKRNCVSKSVFQRETNNLVLVLCHTRLEQELERGEQYEDLIRRPDEVEVVCVDSTEKDE